MKPLFSNNEPVTCIGVMSGTSLDGLDLALCRFQKSNETWQYHILKATTLEYPVELREKLKSAHLLSSADLLKFHAGYGRYIGDKINLFIKGEPEKPPFIASHGHTVFHQPEKRFTFQLGLGAEIAAATGIITVSDFRQQDITFGGQGAPLVPVGDRLLFSKYKYCLNLGGFANISYEDNNRRLAFDICPVNIVLNAFSNQKGKPFDRSGETGKKGNVNLTLLEKLNGLSYYCSVSPKSLGREWVETIFNPILESFDCPFEDKFRTVYEHIAQQIGRKLDKPEEVLVTGGGAFNTFLIERIAFNSEAKLLNAEEILINYKEALIFAFLGLLRLQNEINCYASVTGARQDSCCGTVNLPFGNVNPD